VKSYENAHLTGDLMKQLPAALHALSAYKQFILWKAFPKANGGTDKKPINYQTGRPHDPHDSEIWLTAESALLWLQKSNVADGVGFVLTPNDPFWFIDIDKCLTDQNQWSTLAQELCAKFHGCAVEVSQSGRGLHIIGTGAAPEHGCKDKQNGLEFYTEYRFIALTGSHAVGNAGHSVAPGLLTWLVASYFPRDLSVKSTEWTNGPVEEWDGLSDDSELIERMLKSGGSAAATFGNRASIQALWSADAMQLANFYPPFGDTAFDHSSADMALCSHLAFWTGKDCDRIDRLFRMSGLMRDKWEKRDDYRQSTILGAVGNCKAVYNSGRNRSQPRPQPQPGEAVDYNAVIDRDSNETFANIDRQEHLFKGCVYVTHEHKIFMPDGRMLKPEQFKVEFGGYTFNLDSTNEKVTNNAWEAFTESKIVRFPRASGTCFRPELPPGKIVNENGKLLLNTYVPINTPKIEGDPAPFIDLMVKLFPDSRDRLIITSYLAAIVQYPGVKFQWAPLIQGCEGNGKSFVVTAIARAIGRQYTHFPLAEDISNAFNAWLANKLFIAIEEVYINDSRHKMDTIKWMITNQDVPITPKGVDQYTGENRANFICTSNHKSAIRVARKNNRRWCIFFTPQQSEDDIKAGGMGGLYFPELWKWANNGGFAIINNYLCNFQIPDEFNPAGSCHRAPVTTSTDEAVSAGLGMIEQDIIEAVEEGRTGFCGGWLSSIALDKLLLEKRFKVSRNKRKEIMADLGYIYHPTLKEGRTNNFVPLDNGKPRLYIKEGHESINIATPPEVVRAYLAAQGVTTP
jgi:primase-polymerase (primpol)-like protein